MIKVKKTRKFRVAVSCELLFDVSSRNEVQAKARAERAVSNLLNPEGGLVLRHTLAGAVLYPRLSGKEHRDADDSGVSVVDEYEAS